MFSHISSPNGIGNRARVTTYQLTELQCDPIAKSAHLYFKTTLHHGFLISIFLDLQPTKA